MNEVCIKNIPCGKYVTINETVKHFLSSRSSTMRIIFLTGSGCKDQSCSTFLPDVPAVCCPSLCTERLALPFGFQAIFPIRVPVISCLQASGAHSHYCGAPDKIYQSLSLSPSFCTHETTREQIHRFLLHLILENFENNYRTI